MTEQSDVDSAVITDEGLRSLRNRIGVEIPQREPWYENATKDAIRHFARGYGDLNPLYYDEDYALKTRWGGLIAPPLLMQSMGVSEIKEISKKDRERGKGGGLSGVHGFYSGDDLDFYQPIRIGDRLSVRRGLAKVEDKKSEFAGRLIIETYELVFRNQRNELVGIARNLLIRTERKAAQKKGKYKSITTQHYTDDEMEKIWADYEKEEIRGASPRYWEDVNVGDELAPVVKGPYTHSAFICYVQGAGLPPPAYPYWLECHSRMHEAMKRHPGAFPKTEYGFYDCVPRVHWELELAHKAGLPGYYDYGSERIAFLAHVVTNWMGDDGFLRKLKGEFRRFNYYGDTQWVKGKVTGKTVQDGEHQVELEIWCENQRGETTAPGSATVLLPSKVNGPVVLPAKHEEKPSIFV